MITRELMAEIHTMCEGKGFWPDHAIRDTNWFKLSRVALMHEELSECVHGIRKGLMDDKLPQFTMETCELADTVIRILDYAEAYNLPLFDAIQRKVRYNSSRPFMHGDIKS